MTKTETVEPRSLVSDKNINLKSHFILEYMKKNKASIAFICVSYFITSLILVSYGVVFYFLAKNLYAKDIENVLLFGNIIGGIYFALGFCEILIRTKQKYTKYSILILYKIFILK